MFGPNESSMGDSGRQITHSRSAAGSDVLGDLEEHTLELDIDADNDSQYLDNLLVVLRVNVLGALGLGLDFLDSSIQILDSFTDYGKGVLDPLHLFIIEESLENFSLGNLLFFGIEGLAVGFKTLLKFLSLNSSPYFRGSFKAKFVAGHILSGEENSVSQLKFESGVSALFAVHLCLFELIFLVFGHFGEI